MSRTSTLLIAAALTLAGCANDVTSQAGEDRTHAEPAVQTYSGTGTIMDTEGQPLGEYTVDLTRRPDGPDHVIDITIHLPDGSTREVHQRMSPDEGHGFSLESEGASGGGLDLGEGLLTTYTTSEDGTAHASTIALDEDGMRVVRYELVDGEAVRIYREVYRTTGDQV